MNLLNNFSDFDEIKIKNINKKYLIILLRIILLIISLLIIKKDYYYKNDLLINDSGIILIVDKDVVNMIKDKNNILVSDIETGYSINKIIDGGNICYVNISLGMNIQNISNSKYKILLGKETIFEYIIRIIRKVS